ncbi:hypothetical protein [Promicromonospora sp. NPDC019610]|uniref:hypothetical protein n=1 Tax=Promicromonospora sp. NPDC019610 TaxID=3364405 RepID=UPI0037875FB9
MSWPSVQRECSHKEQTDPAGKAAAVARSSKGTIMDEHVSQTGPEVMRDLVRAASKDPQRLEAMTGSLVDQTRHEPAVARALTIAIRAALRPTPPPGHGKSSTLSLPGFDEQLRDALDDAIRAGTVTDAEVDTYLWLLQQNPGRYDTFDQLVRVVRQAMTST